ncbi:MAG TPA: ABC transporter ATP-binding protein [Blastocatellia bacterium]|nr:ABC transporter ATP-binding protein [Blastocatellia bacterium]
MLEVRDIKHTYSWPVLKGVSFDVAEGEVLAVLGPNGSGKSTLIKIIVGILNADSGIVTLDGRDLHSMRRREAARLIGYVAQESSVRFPLTALEYVLQGRFAQGRLLGFETEDDLLAAKRSMEMTETLGFSSRLVGELSGGERQRVTLARALASRPRLLVLDEPVANLDISHQVKTLQLVRALVADGVTSAIVVTHDLNLAAEFATRVLMLKRGEVLACGSPRETMTAPRLSEVFGASLLVDLNPVTGAPRITVCGDNVSQSPH